MLRRLVLAGFCVGVLHAGRARAHVCMDAPISRVGAGCGAGSPQKVGPCGVRGRTANVTTLRPGQTITLELNETIDHPSHYRIAFNPAGDTFEDPTSADDKSGGHPFVLLDGIRDEAAAKQSITVTLPDVSCDRCTLQLIQVMYDKSGNGFGGNDGVAPDNDDIYYACADLVLQAAASPDASAGAAADGGADAGRPATADGGGVKDAGSAKDAEVDDGGEEAEPGAAADGCGVQRGGGRRGGAWLLGLVVALGLGRRRRAR